MGKITFILLFLIFTGVCTSNTLVISKNGKISTIGKGIEAAKPFDTLLVENGYYRESNIRIDKPLTLKGISMPVIDAAFQSGDLIRITSDNTYISGFIIKNIAVSAVSDNAAIKIVNSSYCKVENNKIVNSFFGIYLSKSKHCYVLNNEISGNKKGESSSGNGIHLWQCNFITIQNNKTHYNRDGIYFEFVKNSTIAWNTSTHNMRYGLHFMFSDYCEYLNNYFISNGAGVAVMYTKNILMKNNHFLDNRGPSSYGLLLKDISDSYIIGNELKNNTIGILAEGSNRLSVSGNNFIRNGWAVKIMANCIDDNFKRNNFLSNTFDVATNGRQNFNTFSENYWSSYEGYDFNRDGYGDEPYRPVKLFSYLASQNEPTIILLRSIFTDLLDVAERAFPSITPETLIDRKPLMRKIK